LGKAAAGFFVEELLKLKIEGLLKKLKLANFWTRLTAEQLKKE